jgi:hypothetical protein
VKEYERSSFYYCRELFCCKCIVGTSKHFHNFKLYKRQKQCCIIWINIPVGEFSETHIGGISLNYSWSHQRFGKLNKLPEKLIGLTANVGADYYFGKKETVAGYSFKYGGYAYLYALGGAIFNPCKDWNITSTAGTNIGYL